MNNRDQIELRTFGLAGWTERVGPALCGRLIKSGYWRGITFLHSAGTGDWKAGSAGAWTEQGIEGFVKKVLTAPIGRQPRKAVEESKMESFVWFALVTLIALFSFSLVFLAACLCERMGFLTM